MIYSQTARPRTGVAANTDRVKEKVPPIIMLINSPIFFVDWALIVFDKKGYRLVVSHRDRIATDRHYSSLKGAKIGFIKFYQYLVFSKEYKPEWSHPYVPNRGWLKGRVGK